MKLRKTNFHRDIDESVIDDLDNKLKDLKSRLEEFVNQGDLTANMKYKVERGISTYRIVKYLLCYKLRRQSITKGIANQIKRILNSALTGGYLGNYFSTPRKPVLKMPIQYPCDLYTLKLGYREHRKDTLKRVNDEICGYLDERGVEYHITTECSLEYSEDKITTNPHFHIFVPNWKIEIINGIPSLVKRKRFNLKELKKQVIRVYEYKNDEIETHRRTFSKYIRDTAKENKRGELGKDIQGDFRPMNRGLRYLAKSQFLAPTEVLVEDHNEDLIEWFTNGEPEIKRLWKITRISGKKKKPFYLGNIKDSLEVILLHLRMIDRLPRRKSTGCLKPANQKEISEHVLDVFILNRIGSWRKSHDYQMDKDVFTDENRMVHYDKDIFNVIEKKILKVTEHSSLKDNPSLHFLNFILNQKPKEKKYLNEFFE